PLTIRRHNHLDDEMDLTPMVDVTFQLLIFFMVSASFSLQKSIEVPTPDPDQKGASQQVQTIDDLHGTSIIVKIDASNTIWIDDEPLGDVNRLADTLRDKMRREQKTELLVTADNQSLHRTIIAVIDAANEVGMQKIRMTSKKKMD
ncbi:MAG: biopolymer transporter ExbD, partial [Schlesneria sp.]